MREPTSSVRVRAGCAGNASSPRGRTSRLAANIAAQEALIKVSQKIGTWNRQGRFTTWLHVVAVNSARSTYRRMKNQAIASDPTESQAMQRPDPRNGPDKIIFIAQREYSVDQIVPGSLLAHDDLQAVGEERQQI